MGCELKRVAMDFDHPVGQAWPGYLPSREPRKCPSDDCDNGSTIAGGWLRAITYLLMMVGDASINTHHELHPWLAALPLRPSKRPGPDAAELTGGLAGRPPRTPFGHDTSDSWSAAAKIVKAAGLPDTWGVCTVCEGHAVHPEDRHLLEEPPLEPPEGEGYQLWENTSEGSPISPVFATLDELCEYAATNCSVFGSDMVSAERWREMLDEGFVRSESTMPDGTKHIFI